MKVTIEAKILLEALKRGGFAALSDDAQSDSSTLSSIIKSIKINATENDITFESATSLSASKYVLPVGDGIEVKETGVIMVSAKDFYDWVNRQGNSVIGIKADYFENPETISVGSATEDVSSKASVKKLGKVAFASKDKSKTGTKWSLDCYDHSQLPSIQVDEKEEPLFIAPLEQLNDGLKNISFAAMPKDSEHLFDSVSFQHKDKALYMVTTDCARCALWLMPNADKISMESTITVEALQGDSEALSKAWKHNVLVPIKMLSEVCKLSSSGAPIEFYRDSKKNWVYISQPNFIVRTATADKSVIEKFPPLDLFLVKKFKKLCKVDAITLSSRLNTAALINKNAVLFTFHENELIIDAISEMGQSPCKANLEVIDLQESFKKVWNVKHFQDILRNSGKEVIFEVADDADKGSMKILSPTHNALYFVMAVERSKYAV